MENIKITPQADRFIDRFETQMETVGELDESSINDLCGVIQTTQELSEALPAFKQKNDSYKELVATCDKNIKEAQTSKKLFQKRCEQFAAALGALLERLNIPGNAVSNGGVKLATSKRTSLEVDEGWLLGQFAALQAGLEAQLPEYITVKLSIDKNKLSAFLKKDTSLLVDYPEKIHTKVTASTTIK